MLSGGKKALQDRNRTCLMWLEDLGVLDPGMFTDACLEGIGAVLKDECIRVRIPESYRHRTGWTIVHFEFLALIISVQVWRQWARQKRFRVFCDNQAVVSVVNTGRSKDPELQRLLRWLCYLLTVNDCMIRLRYIETNQNKIADTLSRSCLNHREQQKCTQLIQEKCLVERVVDPVYWHAFDGW